MKYTRELIDVEVAIRRGRLWVLYPSMALLFLPLAGFVAVAVVADGTGISGWIGAAAVLGPLGLSWLWWAVTLPRWRVWAIERVDDLGKLLIAAVSNQLMWPPGNFFERTEIQTHELQMRLQRGLRRALERYEGSHPDDEAALREFVGPWLYPGRRQSRRPGSAGTAGFLSLILGLGALAIALGGTVTHFLYDAPVSRFGSTVVVLVGVLLTVWGHRAARVPALFTLSLFLIFLGFRVGAAVLRSYPWRSSEIFTLGSAVLVGAVGYKIMRGLREQS